MNDLIPFVGMAAALCTTLSFVPQVFHILKSRNTAGISLGMYATFTVGASLWVLYGIARDDLPVFLANGVTLLLTLAVIGLTLKGRLKRSRPLPAPTDIPD